MTSFQPEPFQPYQDPLTGLNEIMFLQSKLVGDYVVYIFYVRGIGKTYCLTSYAVATYSDWFFYYVILRRGHSQRGRWYATSLRCADDSWKICSMIYPL